MAKITIKPMANKMLEVIEILSNTWFCDKMVIKTEHANKKSKLKESIILRFSNMFFIFHTLKTITLKRE